MFATIEITGGSNDWTSMPTASESFSGSSSVACTSMNIGLRRYNCLDLDTAAQSSRDMPTALESLMLSSSRRRSAGTTMTWMSLG